MNETITVHKLDASGREVWTYTGRLLLRAGSRLVLEALFDREEVVFEGLRLLPGDRFVETFYTDRWFNVFAIHDRQDGRLKGWYCNLTRPARFSVQGNEVFAEDLALDLLVYPDRSWRILDQVEFAQLALDAQERKQALAGLDELLGLAEAGAGPFAAGA